MVPAYDKCQRGDKQMNLPVPADSLHIYLAEINRFPLISKDEEYRLAVRWCEKNDVTAAQMLVTSNLKFVVKIALEYRNYGLNIKDLIQEGNIGLMHAVKKFNPYKGYRLITYAAWWIRSFIQEYILKTSGLVKRSTKALKRKLFYRTPAPRGREPGDPNLSTSAPLAEAELNTNDLSLDTPVDDNLKNCGRTYMERFPSPAASQEEALAEKEQHALVKKDVASALSLLNSKERFVIEKRILGENQDSLEAIGSELGLTRERVRQIESSALKKLKNSLSERPGSG